MSTSKLFSTLQLGELTLKNRVIMASLTRNRSPNTVPNAENAKYYAQRAEAGLILSEGTLISPQGSEWPYAPGIWNDDQSAGWKNVTDAVHKEGGLIFCQLWHIGRVAHPLHQAGVQPPAPSAVQANGGKFRLLKDAPGYTLPRELTTSDITKLFADYKNAAEHAKKGGFDGVEFHSANGYLSHQFLDFTSNKRTDDYGGDEKKRCVFTLKVIDTLIEVYGNTRVGIKLSPGGGYNDVGMPEKDTVSQFSYLISELIKRKLAYIQLVHYWKAADPHGRGTPVDIYQFRHLFEGSQTALLLNGGYNGEKAKADVDNGKAEGIVFGHNYVSTPDIPSRIREGKELAEPNFKTLYDWDGYPYNYEKIGEGYTDYPRAT